MKKYILSFCVIIITNLSTNGQTIISTPQPPSELEYKQKVRVGLTAGPNGSSFRFIHPVFARSLENMDELLDYWITSNNLSEESSLYEINLSVVNFYKRSWLQTNSLLLRDNIPSSTSKMLGFWDFPDAQCGNYALMSIYGVKELCLRLGINPPLFETINMQMFIDDTIPNGGHTFYQYYDYQLDNWIAMDPDVGTTVSSFRNGVEPVSFTQIVNLPEMMLDTNNLVWHKDYYSSTREQALQMHYDFINPMLINDISYNSVTSHQEDSRDMIFNLPAGLTATWEIQINSFAFDAREIALNGPITLSYCDSVFEAGDSLGMMICLNLLSTTFGIPIESVIEVSTIGEIDVDTITEWKVVNMKETFFSIELPPGEWDLRIPTILRSTEPSIVGETYWVNGIGHTDSTYLDVYFSSGLDPFEVPQVELDTAQYGAYCVVPPGMTLTVTFLFNYRLFKFWEQGWEILVEDGSLDVEQIITSPGGDNIITSLGPRTGNNAVNFYPNPTNNDLHFTHPTTLKVYDTLGQLLFRTEKKITSLDLNVTPGIYFIRFGEQSPQRLVITK